MIELIIGIFFGALTSWLTTHWYFKKSSKEVPEWFKPTLNKLPNEKPSKEQLLELFQDALNYGEIKQHPILGHVACPECKAPLKDLEEKLFGDDAHTIVSVSCTHCGWNETTEV